jgi:4-amino-4-deoxy-L-arabinose transferase-like glycosyltransferase
LPLSELAKRGWLLLFLGIAAFYLWGLSVLPLAGPDEPLYSQVAREMFLRHDFVTPTLGGYTWFEKPSLLYWMMMAGYRVFGVGEHGARIGPALSGLLTGVFVYWIGYAVDRKRADSTQNNDARQLEPRRQSLARWSALIWFSSLGAIIFSRAASFDILITMALTGALACFLVWYVRSAAIGGLTAQRSFSADVPISASRPSAPLAVEKSAAIKSASTWLLVGFYFFIGVSLLAKGLIGIVIPFGIIGTFFLLRRELSPRAFMKSLLWGVPLALAVAGLWYGPVIHRHGWKFIDEFIIQHHFARFLTNKYHHPEAFYFYGPVLVAFSFPWTIFLASAFISARRWKWRGPTSIDRMRVFALVWILVPIVFFSLSGSKLTTYILPVLPGVALLVGDQITQFLAIRRGNLVLRLTGLFLICLAIFGGFYLARGFHGSPVIVVAAALPIASAGAAALVRPQLRRGLLILIPIALFITSAVALKWAGPILTRPESDRDLLLTASARGYGGTPVVQLHTIERTAEFYAAGRMSYGPKGEPIKLEGATQVVDAARRNGGVVLCFVPLEYESQLTTLPSIQAEAIGDNTRAALIAVRVR